MRFEVRRARTYYAESRPLIAMVRPKNRPAMWALIEIYRRLLERIEQSGYDVLSRRIHLSPLEKAGLLARAALKPAPH